MASYVLSRLAAQDIESIGRYTLFRYGAAQTKRYLAAIDRSAQTAANFPHIGREHITPSGSRYLRYNCGRHAIFYRQQEDGIFIGRVLNLVMDFDRHLD